MSGMSCTAERVLARLVRAQRVLITGHLNPDGDSLGSQLALAELAERLGAEVAVIGHDQIPSNYSQLPQIERLVVSTELPADAAERFDTVIAVECPDPSRAGYPDLAGLALVNIDHHTSNEMYAQLNFVDPQAPAVGEMVWQLYSRAGVQPSTAAATNLYLALVTDTGDFRYANATPRAFLAAAALVEAGAGIEQVAGWVHDSRSVAAVRLLGEARRTWELSCDNRLASIWVDQHAFAAAEASSGDTEDIINTPRSIAGVEVVVFFKQAGPDAVRVSLRSKGSHDVCRVAQRFGGGGHVNAAGCTVQAGLLETRERVTRELRSMFEEAG